MVSKQEKFSLYPQSSQNLIGFIGLYWPLLAFEDSTGLS